MNLFRDDRPTRPRLLTELAAKIAPESQAGKAVAAVVALHEPQEQGGGDPPEWAPWQGPLPVTLVCYACSDDDGTPWPCPTIRAVMTVYEVGQQRER